MMKMKLNKKIAGASAMLLLSTTMLGTSTFAWFTMSKEVEVTGMELKTKVSGNLLISSDNVDADYSSLDLVQGRMGLLEPVSSVDGSTGSFYYTVNATARGTKQADGVTVAKYNETASLNNDVAGKTAYDTTFNNTYKLATSGTFDASTVKMNPATSQLGAGYGYIDYVFYLKATTDAANQPINMTECNLIYNDGSDKPVSTSGTAGDGIDRAWRVGVFATDITTNGGKGYDVVKSIDPATSTNQKAVLGLQDAIYFSGDTTVGGTAGQNMAQNGTTANALGTVTNYKNGTGDGVVLDTIAAINTTKYYKVLVRVWLEGEDNTCNTRTYAALQTGKWALNCKFELGEGNAINKINSDTNKKADTRNGTQSGTNTYDVE